MKRIYPALICLLCLSTVVKSQDYKDYLSDYWNSYYDKYPSGIKDAHKASDFIRIIEYTGFIPRSKDFNKDVELLKRSLLSLDYADLRQLMIKGDFYSRTKMHDDYYTLYNITYTKITKEIWDRYCPYLIPLMKVDGVISSK